MNEPVVNRGPADERPVAARPVAARFGADPLPATPSVH